MPEADWVSAHFCAVCYQGSYGGSIAASTLEACRDAAPYVALGAKATAASATLTLVALARSEDALAPTSSTSQAQGPHFGVYWYNMDGKSLGFAPSSTVELNSADIYDGSDPYRLSWHKNDGGDITAGWRAGATTGLNSDGVWTRVIYSCAEGASACICDVGYHGTIASSAEWPHYNGSCMGT